MNLCLLFLLYQEKLRRREGEALLWERLCEMPLPQQKRRKEFARMGHDYRNYILVLRNIARKKQEREEPEPSLLSARRELEDELSKLFKEAEKEQGYLTEQHLLKMGDRPERGRYRPYCRNEIVNAVMEEKERMCRALAVELDAELLVPGKLLVEPLCLCSLFTNLLDNAIEAAGKLEDTKGRVKIRAGMKGNYLLVRVENTAGLEHVRQKKRRGRGRGTLILKDIAKRYEGVYITSYENGIYTAVAAVKAL